MIHVAYRCDHCKDILDEGKDQVVFGTCIECYIKMVEEAAKKHEQEQQFQLEEEERAWGMN